MMYTIICKKIDVLFSSVPMKKIIILMMLTFLSWFYFFFFCISDRRGNEDRVYCKPLDSVPVSDQHVALGILLELAVQRGSLQHMLEAILLLLELWDSGQDNDTDSCFTSAPLIHLLQRFEEISGASQKTLEPNKLADEVNLLLNVLILFTSNIYLPSIGDST